MNISSESRKKFGAHTDMNADRKITAVLLAGQSSDWYSELKLLASFPEVMDFLKNMEEHLIKSVEKSAIRGSGMLEYGIFPLSWITGRIDVPLKQYLSSSAVSQVMLYITSVAHAISDDLFPDITKEIKVLSGHSQGIVAALSISWGKEKCISTSGYISEYLVYQGIRMQQSSGYFSDVYSEDGIQFSPMLSITGIPFSILNKVINTLSDCYISLKNSSDRFVVSGDPSQLKKVVSQLENLAGKSSALSLSWDWEPLKVSGPFHSPMMAEGRRLIDHDLLEIGLDFNKYRPLCRVYGCEGGTRMDLLEDISKTLLDMQYTGTVDWPHTVERIVSENNPTELVIPGPGDGLLKLTGMALFGSSIPVMRTRNETMQSDNILTGPLWFSSVTGRKPVILGGMTPTTATSEIVSAAANAGFLAELAGGGQVTEQIFRERMNEIRDSLESDIEIVLNTLYLDPYLWNLHVAKDGLIFKLKKEGYPIAGLTVSAGVPEIKEAGELLKKLNDYGMWLNSFKAGTPEQIESIIAIAEAYPEYSIILQMEGGEAGGHHSTYPLMNLLTRYYNRIRKHSNILLATGGGIRNRDDATKLLSGTWYSSVFRKPVDAVITGTLAMVAKEAETSNGVRKLLVEAKGSDSPLWEKTDSIRNGRSSLGAPIWYLANEAEHTASFLQSSCTSDELANSRKDEIVKLLNISPKPYFGDIEKMTYLEVLSRFLTLVRHFNSAQSEPVWIAENHKQIFSDLLNRTLERMDFKDTDSSLEHTSPEKALEFIRNSIHEINFLTVIESDKRYFFRCFKTPGKPVPFVWEIGTSTPAQYLSDGLFYSHDPEMDPQQVIVIPGPRAIDGINRESIPVENILTSLIDSEFIHQEEVYQDYSFNCLGAEIPSMLFSRVSIPVFRIFSQLAFSVNNRQEVPSIVKKLISEGKNYTVKIFSKGESVTLSDPAGILLTVNYVKSVIKVKYLVRFPDSTTAELIFEFSVNENGTIILNRDKYLSGIKNLYSANVFREPLSLNEYAAVVKRMRRTDSSFLPWYISKALPAMIDVSGVDPLGLVHFRSDARICDIETDDKLSTDLITAGNNKRLIIEDSVDGKFIETEGEFISKSQNTFAFESLEASEFKKVRTEYENDVFLGKTLLSVPSDSIAFAICSGDYNPLHFDDAIARLAGFDGIIIHGMWTLASTFADFEKYLNKTSRITQVETRYLSPVFPSEKLSIEYFATGRAEGEYIYKAVVSGEKSEPKAEIAFSVSSPVTAYIFPGQGVQKQGMHLGVYQNNAAGKKIWDDADEFTRSQLGFSLIEIVRDNPKSISVKGENYTHPQGVLNLTQFTQVSLVVLACSQIADLRDKGSYIETAAFSGHSLGEYSSLSAVGDILSLRDVVRVVYHRGLTMQNFVPRDETGKSPFKMGVVRPNHAGFSENHLITLVNEISKNPENYIEIVNFNARGRQYSVTGFESGLKILEKEIGSGITGKPPYIEVPGVDVPFHSSLLRNGVEAFRKTLRETFPDRIDPARLVDRYYPNLMGEVFSIDRDYIEKVKNTTSSPVLDDLLSQMNEENVDEEVVTSTLMVELLAYQFASPVQWIRIQENLLDRKVENIIEVGPGHQPTLSNLMHQTRKYFYSDYDGNILHIENSTNVIDGNSIQGSLLSIPDIRQDEITPEKDLTPILNETKAPAPTKVIPVVKHDTNFRAPDLTESAFISFLAMNTGAFPEDITSEMTIEELLQGNSARRNQLLSEIQKEFRLSSTDGLADKKLSEVAKIITTETEYNSPGEYLKKQLGILAVSAGASNISGLTAKITSGFSVTENDALIFAIRILPYIQIQKSRLTGNENPLFKSVSDKNDIWGIMVSSAVSGTGAQMILPPKSPSDRQESSTVSSEALDNLENQIFGEAGLFKSIIRNIRHYKKDISLKDLSVNKTPAYTEVDTPVFDEKKIISFTSTGNWIREAILQAVLYIEKYGEIPDDSQNIFSRDPEKAISIINWYMNKSDNERKKLYSSCIDTIKRGAANTEILKNLPAKTPMNSEINSVRIKLDVEKFDAVITGAGPGSIALEIMKNVLRSGKKAVVGVSSLNEKRVKWFAEIFRKTCVKNSELHIVPFRQGNFEDVRNFSIWSIDKLKSSENVSVYPFAAQAKNGFSGDVSFDFDSVIRVNLTGIVAMTGIMAQLWSENSHASPLKIILPMSPNQGAMGGDGLYGETKAGLRVLLNKWHSEPLLNNNTWICGAVIGWVRGTGLMGAQDSLAGVLEEKLGIKTWSSQEMGLFLSTLGQLSVDHPESIEVDITGGISSIPDWGTRLREIRSTLQSQKSSRVPGFIPESDSLPIFRGNSRMTELTGSKKPNLTIPSSEIIVVCGYGEIGPYGDEDARWDIEQSGTLSDKGIFKLAVETGKIKWDSQKGYYTDSEGNQISERDAVKKFGNIFKDITGIRFKTNESPEIPDYPSFENITLTEDLYFNVESEETVRLLKASEGDNLSIVSHSESGYSLKKKKGSVISVPVRRKMKNTVAGMVPDGWDCRNFGLSEGDANDIDRNSQFMLYTVMRAINRAMITTSELNSRIHTSRTGNSIGTGIGGMERLIRLYTDPVRGVQRDPVSLQESLGNVGPGHVSQEVLGNHGPMISPVAACATAGVSIESAMEKIITGKADVMFAGACDDLSYAGTVGFDDMAATVDVDFMNTAGISPARMSRPHDTHRKGFVESQGGGAVMITKLDTALSLGLPVYAILGGGWTFGDGHSKSIPAPGFGLLSVAYKGENGFLGRALSKYNLDINDIAVVSMHGTSTPVNDPHESGIYSEIFKKMGRDKSNPALVISQKAVTGHPKGGAAAFQLNGVIQSMRDSIVPPHLNLDNPDVKMDSIEHLIYPSSRVRVPQSRYKAALISTLGFGHVSSMMLVINPSILNSILDKNQCTEYNKLLIRRSMNMRFVETDLGLRPLLNLNREKPHSSESDEINYLLGE
ncbi:MAG: DUF1729 domain-containing protein [Deltaproteobacteria bacterium]|nr:DUF1729 domain-containing protein [Deltaproteobacteria bacterium]